MRFSFYKPFGKRAATTLVELMITVSIFSAVAVTAIGILMNTMQSTRRIQSQVFLYTEAQAAMDLLARSVENSTVDYEAYFDRNVLGGTAWHTEHYGYYGQSFYDPGTAGPVDEGPYDLMTSYAGSLGSDYGVHCYGTGSTTTDEYPADCPTETPIYAEGDLGTGQFPYTGDSQDASAFCGDAGHCSNADHQLQDELILVNGNGDERFVFRLIGSEGNYKIGKTALSGTDRDGDGTVDLWTCMSGYDCGGTYSVGGTDYSVPREEDFKALTPSFLNVKSFTVIVSPAEDPFKAFAESDQQIQPQVTLIMTLTLSDDYTKGLLGNAPEITLQRTVSTGVYAEVESYGG
jgi:type II secretory pathway pseudopilin PulG